METEEELKTRLVEVTKLIATKEGELKKIEQAREKTDEWKQVQERKKEIEKERDALDSKEDKIVGKIKSKFIGVLDSRHNIAHEQPYYTKEPYAGISTNIHNDVIEAIRKHLKISLLRASDIESMVRDIIRSEEEKNKELQEIREKEVKLSEERSTLWELERKETDKERYIHDEIYVLKVERDKLEFKIEHPEKKEHYDKRDAERRKVGDPKVIKAILRAVEEKQDEKRV